MPLELEPALRPLLIKICLNLLRRIGADQLYLAPESAVITPGGGWAAGDLIILEVTRKATHVNDTLAIDARLHGLKLMMTVNAGTDA